jgi:hypothetical protein
MTIPEHFIQLDKYVFVQGRNTGSVKSFIAAIADVEFLKVAKLIYNR